MVVLCWKHLEAVYIYAYFILNLSGWSDKFYLLIRDLSA